MPVSVERLPEESIITATVSEPFNPELDMPAMFAKIIELRRAVQGDVAMILDVGGVVNTPDAFHKMVLALAEASRGVRASREAGVVRPPITIFVGSGPIADLASKAMAQEQYGGVGGDLCGSLEDALALARARLSTP